MSALATNFPIEQHVVWLRTAVDILSQWGVDPQRAAQILTIDYEQIEIIKNSAKGATRHSYLFTEDQLQRAILLDDFDTVIKAIFENPVNQRNFPSLADTPLGNGSHSLLERLETGELSDWYSAFTHLRQGLAPW
jgi:hypothetical protein